VSVRNFRLQFWEGVANPQSWGKGGLRGSGMVPFERALVSSYRPSIVTFPLSLCTSEIFYFYSPKRHFFPTPPLVFPKFSHVTLGVGGLPFGYKQQRYWADCPCNYFQRFPTYVITIHPRHRQTDRRRDRKTTLCTKVHWTVKTSVKIMWSIQYSCSVRDDWWDETVSDSTARKLQ